MTPFRLDNPRICAFGSWRGLEEKATSGPSPAPGHLRVLSASEAKNSRAKRLRTPNFVYLARHSLHRNLHLTVSRKTNLNA
jgi:hypothetical protein